MTEALADDFDQDAAFRQKRSMRVAERRGKFQRSQVELTDILNPQPVASKLESNLLLANLVKDQVILNLDSFRSRNKVA